MTIEGYKNKVLGSMVGGAVGDALGYPVEFLSYRAIVAKYGEQGITRYDLNNKGVAEISDDTQMSLFTANGMLFCFTRYACRGVLGAEPADYIRDSYIEWYQTQTGDIDYTKWHYNWIREVKEMHARRAPGTTCLSALQHLSQHQEVKNNSKGCGGIMRVAPVPLFLANPVMESPCTTDSIVDTTMKVAGITHKHPLGQLPAALLTYIIEKVLPLAYITQTQFCQYIHEGLNYLQKKYADQQVHLDVLKELAIKAITLSSQKKTDAEAISSLGEGWVAEETLAIALYCVLKYIDDFESAIIASVNHSGDSDSTGAVTGNIMGAILGYHSIPTHFTDKLELKWLIEELASDLATVIPVGEYINCYDTPEKRRWMEKYVTLLEKDSVPIKNSYLVHRDLNIYAGEYPGDKTEFECKVKLGSVAQKCSYFFDLTESGELAPYEFYLTDEGKEQIHAQDKKLLHFRFPIRDCGVPDNTYSVVRLLDSIIHIGKSTKGWGDGIYIHCWGGVGRTGTIVACFYAYMLKGKGLSAESIYEQAMNSLQDSFSRCPKSKHRISPETKAQKDFIWRFVQNECL